MGGVACGEGRFGRAVAGEDGDGLGQGVLRVEGGVEGEVWPREGSAVVEREVEAGEVLHAVFGVRLEQHQKSLFGGGLSEDTAVGRRGELGAWVRGRHAKDCSHVRHG